VVAVIRPVREGFGLRPGSLRLLALRLGALLAFFVPAQLAGAAGWSERVGANPRFTPTDGPLPTHDILDGLTNLSPVFLGLLGLSIALWLLCDQLLTAVAARTLAPERGGPVRVWRALWDEGWPAILPYARVVVLSLAFGAVGAALIGKGFTRLDVAQQAAGATGEVRALLLPLLRACTIAAWLTLVGAFGFWCKVIIAVDGRRRVRRVVLEVCRVFLRAPLRGPGLYFISAFSLTVAGPVVLLGKGLPVPGPAPVIAWVAFCGLQALVWHTLVHAASRLYATERFADIRDRGDAPLGWLRKLRLVR
jgi:hypothetical protein